MKDVLCIENLAFFYNSHRVIHDLSFNLFEEEIICLIGSSGSGKSTLLKLISGLLTPHSGTVSFVDKQASQVSYMTQEDLLLPWRNVWQNLLLPLELGKRTTITDQKRNRATMLLKEFSLTGTEHFFPSELSGGMRQRVSLARSLMLGRPVLLLDEPFGALDVALREQLYLWLRMFQKKEKLSVIMVTHDFRDAISLADRIFLLYEGRIQKEWNRNHHQEFNSSLFQELKESILHPQKN